MSCARCGCGIYKTEDFISLNKVWHKNCFSCYQCTKRLDKNTAKIFQGELFCETCYANVIEKLFEVISCPSINRPCKVASTPSCAVTNNICCEKKIRNCENIGSNCGHCGTKEYCFSAEKKFNQCIQRTVQSCSCIPSQSGKKDEYCFIFPIPREVANYYNRAHMKNKACKDPICCTQSQDVPCSCRTCCSAPKCPPVQIRALKNQCCCNSSSSPRCGSPSPQRCCCSPSCKPKTAPVVFQQGCGCCLPPKPMCSDPCPTPNRCVPCNCSPPCRRCCPKKPQKTKCPQSPSCSPCKYPPPQCCPPAQCCSTPQRYVSPARCPPPQRCCSPSPCIKKLEECCCCSRCDPSSSENLKNCYRRSYCQNTSKYCVCGSLSPCNCKMSQIKAQCTVCCVRCGQKVYAAEKILVSSGAFHTSCFTCFCCKKCLDVKNVFEGCGEIYCKQCYNHFVGVEYYGFGGKNC